MMPKASPSRLKVPLSRDCGQRSVSRFAPCARRVAHKHPIGKVFFKHDEKAVGDLRHMSTHFFLQKNRSKKKQTKRAKTNPQTIPDPFFKYPMAGKWWRNFSSPGPIHLALDDLNCAGAQIHACRAVSGLDVPNVLFP